MPGVWFDEDAKVGRVRFVPQAADPENPLVGELFLNGPEGVLKLGYSEGDTIDLYSIPELEDVYLNNMFIGATINASSWHTDPSNLANAIDGNETTVTGTGSEHMATAGVLGWIEFNMGRKYKVALAAKLGMWSTVGGVNMYWQYMDDSGEWHYVMDSTQPTTAVDGDITENVKFTRLDYAYAQNVRMRFYGTAAQSAYIKIYEAYAFNLDRTEGEIIPVITSGEGLLGWGGYLSSSNLNTVIDKVWSTGCRVVRWWSCHDWYGDARGWGAAQYASYNNYAVADAFVTACYSRGMMAILDCNHNFYSNQYQDNIYKTLRTTNHSAFKHEWLLIASRYRNYSNVVLELVNEYSASAGEVRSAAGSIMKYLRDNNITNKILWNFWWECPIINLSDPQNYYAVGRHLYPGQSLALWSHAVNASLDEVCADEYSGSSTIDKTMYRYFDSPSETFYYQRVKDLSIPLGWMLTETGMGAYDAPLDSPVAPNNAGGIAFNMRLRQYAYSRGVVVTDYRIGAGNRSYQTTQDEYETAAATQFDNALGVDMSLYPWNW